MLLVAKRDRIGRLEPLAMAMIEAAVRRNGARIISAAGEGTEDDDPASILMRRMIDAFAEYERLIIGARTKSALAAKRRRGEKTGGPVPFGFQAGPDKIAADGSVTRTLVPCPVEQEIIRLVIELRDAGETLQTIADNLNARGICRREAQHGIERTFSRFSRGRVEQEIRSAGEPTGDTQAGTTRSLLEEVAEMGKKRAKKVTAPAPDSLVGVIAARMKGLNLTAYRVAKMSGVDVSQIQRMIDGKRYPKIDTVDPIVKALDLVLIARPGGADKSK